MTCDLEDVYVCDMGIAKVKREAERTVTSLSKGPGTYPYIAPEMFKKSHRGPSADMYSLGCLLIELYGRRRVWPNMDGPDIMLQVLGSYETAPQMPNTADLEEPYCTICSKLCQLDPAQRPKSGELLQMLRDVKIE